MNIPQHFPQYVGGGDLWEDPPPPPRNRWLKWVAYTAIVMGLATTVLAMYAR